ncbi:unnamed protein product [Meganyctiphanes norvegica]|uniref:Uncharacterized protein n=1 Tax=Meganyctiphanes norvegica TaxID=48144 RepID=A0AAV2S026_MEGNR
MEAEDTQGGAWDSEMDTLEGEETMEDGDLGHGPTNKHYMDMINKDEYYNSPKFAIGYHELQSRWTGNWNQEQGPPMPQDLTPDHQDDGYRLLVPGTQRDTARQRRQNLNLPLSKCHEDSSKPPSSPAVSRLRKQPWASLSATNSPMGTPSPRSSCPGTPASSPCPSPKVRRPWKTYQAVADPGYMPQQNSGDTLAVESRNQPHNTEEHLEETKGNRGIMDTLRRIVGNFRRRRPEILPHTPELQERVSILESELETYRQFSEAKRTAADLLKHQLMEVLYEKVVAEVEQKHRRRELEHEIMGLEFQLQLLYGAAEHNWRDWIDRLDKEPRASAQTDTGTSSN